MLAKKSLELAKSGAADTLREAKLEAQKIIDEANKQRSAIIDKATEEANLEKRKILDHAKVEIEAERNKAKEVINKIDEVLGHHLFPPRADGSDPRICPECGKGRLSIKLGKFGAFIGCSNYPECKYTHPLVDTSDEENNDTPKIKEAADKVLGESNGQNIYLKKGPYGYYVQLGEDATATTEKPKRSSLPKGIDAEEITFEQAQRLLSLPLDLGDEIILNSGKFGPYIKQGNKSVSLRGNDNIFNITKDRAVELLGSAKEKPQGKVLGTHPKNKQSIQLLMGRYGPYIKCGRTNYAIPKTMSGHELKLEEAIKIIDSKKN